MPVSSGHPNLAPGLGKAARQRQGEDEQVTGLAIAAAPSLARVCQSVLLEKSGSLTFLSFPQSNNKTFVGDDVAESSMPLVPSHIHSVPGEAGVQPAGFN